MKKTISVLVQNQSGVLAHVAGMFAARGYNIDSLAVGRTDDPNISRMTIVVIGDDAVLEQVRKQLGKIVPVLKIFDFTTSPLAERELMLISVASPAEKRPEIHSLVEMFNGKVVDIGSNFVTVEVAGPNEKVEAFIDMCRPYGIKDVVRTGTIALPRKH